MSLAAASAIGAPARTESGLAAVPLVTMNTSCRNCATSLSASMHYCPNCGQETATHPPSAGEFVHEFVGHYVAFEGALWRTLGLLLFIPGELTKRYLAGQKRRYVLPLRLYLTVSLLFFLVVNVFGVDGLVRVNSSTSTSTSTNPNANTAAVATTEPAVKVPKRDNIKVNTKLADGVGMMFGESNMNKPLLTLINCTGSSLQCDQFREHMKSKYGDATLGVALGRIKDRVFSYAPYAMFALLPLFALLTKLLYWRRGMYYGEHLVYAFHVHSFAFLALIAQAQLPEVIGQLVAFAAMLYFAIAMQRVFAGRWWATALRYATISFVYPLLLLTAITVTLALAIFL